MGYTRNLTYLFCSAFAKRFLPKGTIVSGSPLLHGFEKTLEMFHLHFNNGPVKDLDGSQILLNYCFGHHDSTLLLCPYGSGEANFYGRFFLAATDYSKDLSSCFRYQLYQP